MVCYSQCRSGREHRVVIFPIPLVQRGLRMHHRPRLRLRGCCTATWHRLALPSRYHRRHAAVCGPACLHPLEGDGVSLPTAPSFCEGTALLFPCALAALSRLRTQRCVPPASSSGTPASRIGPEEALGDAGPEKCLGRQLPRAVNSPEPPQRLLI